MANKKTLAGADVLPPDRIPNSNGSVAAPAAAHADHGHKHDCHNFIISGHGQGTFAIHYHGSDAAAGDRHHDGHELLHRSGLHVEVQQHGHVHVHVHHHPKFGDRVSG